MKSLDSILTKREQLKGKLEELKQQTYGIDLQVMTSLERKDYARLMGSVKLIEVQIDALTYVINYDSELMDVTKKGGN